MNIIKAYRTFMPEILYPGTGLSPTTNKSVVPTNNVFTIQDVLDGRRYQIPGGGGDWSTQWGEDVSKSYKDEGDDYKRQERDSDILNKMMTPIDMIKEKWIVYVPGGSRSFISQNLANEYRKSLLNKGIQVSRIVRKVAQNDKTHLIADCLDKTFMVETINMEEGVKLNGAAFCIAPGYFITCAHVIRKYNKNTEKILDINEITATTKVSLVRRNSRFAAEIFVLDAINDIAIIKSSVECDHFELDKLVEVGDDILTIGSPHGFENNISFGSVGGVKRKIYTYENAPEYIFVDLSAFTGNSGGPIIKESNGKVIGMLTAIVTNSEEYGLNAGLPSKYIEELCIINKIL